MRKTTRKLNQLNHLKKATKNPGQGNELNLSCKIVLNSKYFEIFSLIHPLSQLLLITFVIFCYHRILVFDFQILAKCKENYDDVKSKIIKTVIAMKILKAVTTAKEKSSQAKFLIVLVCTIKMSYCANEDKK